MTRKVVVIGDSMSLAHVTRAMVMARRLAEEGADVVFATGPAHQDLARQEGFEPREVYCVPPARAYEAICRGSHIFDRSTLEQYVNSDLELIKTERPDLIVGDMRLSLNISAELSGVEHWSILSGYLTPYYSAPQTPPRTLPLTRWLGPRLSRAAFPAIKRMVLRYYAENFRRYRRDLGLTPVRDIFEVITSPHRNLIADLPCYVPCSELPEHFEYVGPLLWEPDIPDPYWLGHLDPNRPTAYVTMGSTGNPHALQQVLVTLRDHGWQVLATMGPDTPVPNGVHAVRLARGSSMLQHSAVTICHGGSGTVYQSVSHGVPVVGIPSFHDQEINMDRVEAMGWGAGMDPIRWRPADLLDAVARARSAACTRAVDRSRHDIAAFVRQSTSRRLLSSGYSWHRDREAPPAPQANIILAEARS